MVHGNDVSLRVVFTISFEKVNLIKDSFCSSHWFRKICLWTECWSLESGNSWMLDVEAFTVHIEQSDSLLVPKVLFIRLASTVIFLLAWVVLRLCYSSMIFSNIVDNIWATLSVSYCLEWGTILLWTLPEYL